MDEMGVGSELEEEEMERLERQDGSWEETQEIRDA